MGWGQDILGIGLHGSAAPRASFLPPSRFEPLGHFIPELEDAIVRGKYGTPPNESDNDGQPGLPEYYSADDEAETEAHNDAISNLDEAGEGWAFHQYITENFGQTAWDYLFGPEEDGCEDPWGQRFDPPVPAISGESSNRCQRVVKGIKKNETECPPPLLGCPQCSVDVSRDPNLSVAYDRDLVFQPNFGVTIVTEDELDYLYACWNFLVQNADIVLWVACLVEGSKNAWCIVDRLFGRNGPTEIIFDDYPSPKHISVKRVGGEHPTMEAFGKDVYVASDSGNEVWFALVDAFSKEEVESDKLCDVVPVAAVLLHELVHGCVSGDGGDVPNECYTPYVIENAFLWAVSKRYPCLTGPVVREIDGNPVIFEEGPCAPLAEDDVWMSDTGNFPP